MGWKVAGCIAILIAIGATSVVSTAGATAARAASAHSHAPAASRRASLGQADLRAISFESADLRGTARVDVLLPDAYDSSSRRYPVLYLLAGHTGSYDQWPTHSDVVALARGLPLIVVMPDGGRGWYADPVSGSGP